MRTRKKGGNGLVAYEQALHQFRVKSDAKTRYWNLLSRLTRTYPPDGEVAPKLIENFSNDDGDDGNENGKKTIGLISKTTFLHVHHTFLYISLPSLHDYDVKMPTFTIYGERKQATTNFLFSF